MTKSETDPPIGASAGVSLDLEKLLLLGAADGTAVGGVAVDGVAADAADPDLGGGQVLAVGERPGGFGVERWWTSSTDMAYWKELAAALLPSS